MGHVGVGQAVHKLSRCLMGWLPFFSLGQIDDGVAALLLP